jgi:hypothetical protein
MKEAHQGRFVGFFILTGVVVVILLPLTWAYQGAVRGLALSGDDPRRVAGFLGTGASLAADLSLLAYLLLLVPLMLYGYAAARRQLFVPQHKYAMTFVTVLNWAIIAYLMAVSYSGAVPYYSARAPNQLIVPTLHLITGGIAQVLATVSLIRMWFEYRLPVALRYEPIKAPMRATLILWLVTAALGIGIYITWYGVPWQPRPEQPMVAPTEEATPQATEAPEATSSPTASPAATEEATPAAEEPSAPAATEDSSTSDDALSDAKKATIAAEDAAKDATKNAERATKRAD